MSFTKFYQVCAFQNPYTNRYHVRKFIINDANEFINVKEYKLKRKRYQKFFEIKNSNEYKCYSTYDLKNVSYPAMADILTAKSSILGNNYGYTGFAPFTNL